MINTFFWNTFAKTWREIAPSYLALLTLGVISALLYRDYGLSSLFITVVLFLFIRVMLQRRLEDEKTIRKYAAELQKRYNASIITLAETIDVRDPYTYGHSVRVAKMARHMARVMKRGVQPEDAYLAGLLHDVGKIALSDAVLHKRSKLNFEEWSMMMQHPLLGLKLLKNSGVSREVLQAVRSHHEWYSGGGYPDNLTGDSIPLLARVVSVADAVDAMVSNRPYRRGSPLNEAVRRVEESAGRQFDPEIVKVYLRALGALTPQEMEDLGYGKEPPNKDMPPVAEIEDTNTRALELQMQLSALTLARLLGSSEEADAESAPTADRPPEDPDGIEGLIGARDAERRAAGRERGPDSAPPKPNPPGENHPGATAGSSGGLSAFLKISESEFPGDAEHPPEPGRE